MMVVGPGAVELQEARPDEAGDDEW